MKKAFVLFAVLLLPIAAMNVISNSPPSKPVITGPSSGEAGKTYTYTVVSTDPDGDKIKYCIDWGDGNEFCSDFIESGKELQLQHSWSEKGTYTITVTATDEHGAESEPATLTVKMPYVMTAGYHGNLKIYVVEPVSRWYDHDGDPYKFGFLDFAYDDVIYTNYGETRYVNAVWDAAAHGYSDAREDNIMAIAVLFNPTPHDGKANPPFGNPFDAYYVDACAAAAPGRSGENARSNATHTVFIEMGTETTCPYCPTMLNALYNVYKKGEYPFYFVSLIGDKNKVAYDRLRKDYNLYGYPTAFVDGGRRVILGGIENEGVYERAIKYCKDADAHDFDMKIKCNWNNGKLYINVTLKDMEKEDDIPPTLTVEKPKAGYLYLFDREIMKLPFGFAVVVGSITIKVNASDDSGVEKVTFNMLHEETFDDTEPPYEYTYKGSFGKHSVEILAYDTFGNVAKEDFDIFVI